MTLAERLQRLYGIQHPMVMVAADHINALRAENERMKEALRSIVVTGDDYSAKLAKQALESE